MTMAPNRPDADRQWILQAARGDIDNDQAIHMVHTMRWNPNIVTQDPELAAALTQGDQLHPNDPRRWPTGPPPWETTEPPDPETNQAFDDLTAEWAPDDPIFVNWAHLWDDEDHPEWLYENVFALYRGHVVYAKQKQGKSLFVLWVCAQLATTRIDVDIIYLDYEMTRDDLRERLDDMGYGPDSDLERLHYALLPSLPPLDTGEGAGALLELCDQVQIPDRHLFVVIDTTARAVQGEENSNDTIREFYRWSGTPLKRRQITWVRLDHAGKDATKGQRGGSAKGDDVDVVWRLTAADDGVKLHRDAARMSWVPEEVSFAKTGDPLQFQPGAELWPEGTGELAKELERLGVPLDATYFKAKKMGAKGRKTAVLKALKFRRWEAGTKAGTGLANLVGNQNGNHPERAPINKPSTSTNNTGNQHGNRAEPRAADAWEPVPPPKGEPFTSHLHANPGELPPIPPGERF